MMSLRWVAVFAPSPAFIPMQCIIPARGLLYLFPPMPVKRTTGTATC